MSALPLADGPAMYLGGSILTFALPYGAFIVITTALYFLFRAKHNNPRLKYMRPEVVSSVETREPGPVPAPMAKAPATPTTAPVPLYRTPAQRRRQIEAVKYLDTVVEELFDLVPRNTYITITSDHGELFGEGGYFGHGPIQHEKVFEVPFLEGKLR